MSIKPVDGVIQTPFGVFSGITSYSNYPSGMIREIRLNEKNMVVTHVGELIPYYCAETPRRKNKPSVSFYESGLIQSVYLEQQQEIETPIGEFPAEMVVFYETGELKRFFPLEGQISGFWSEEEERELNIPFSFDLGFTQFTAMLVGIYFYKSGEIKSITLYPKETISVATAYGEITVRNGFSLYENGKLKSCEPAAPIGIETPIGKIHAFDINATGVNADTTSLRFDENGKIVGLITSGDRIAVQNKDGVMKFITPIVTESEDEEPPEVIPVEISFDYTAKTVRFRSTEILEYVFDECSFTVFKGDILAGCSPDDCASCNLCDH